VITDLRRINEVSNPSEWWSFTMNSETYYWSTGPSYMIDLAESQWDQNGRYTGSIKVGEREQAASTFLSVIRGKEPYEIETMWYLPEFMSFKVEDKMPLILKMLILGERTVDEVCYPC